MSLEALEQLIAGIGRSGVRNLHIRDTNHEDEIEYRTLEDQGIGHAIVVGGFANRFYEGDARRTPDVDPDAVMQIHLSDARYAAFDETAARFPAYAAAYRTYGNDILALSQFFHERIPTDAELQAEWDRYRANYIRGGGRRTLPPDAPQNLIDAYAVLGPALWRDVTSDDLNTETVENMREVMRQRPGNNIIVMGASHTANRGIFQNADLNTIFPGLDLVILRSRDSVNAQGESERVNALRGDDRPDFIFYTDETGDDQIEDLRAPGDRDPSLEELLERGRTAIAGGTTVEAQNTVAPGDDSNESTDEDEDDDQPGIDMENMPWGNLIGAGIGAWLTSTMGGNNMFVRVIAMLVGGLIGWVAGGAMSGNHGSPFLGLFNRNNEHENETETGTHEEEREAAPQVSVLAPDRARTLAFGNVSSTHVPLEVGSADAGELLDAPKNFIPPSISEVAPTLH